MLIVICVIVFRDPTKPEEEITLERKLKSYQKWHLLILLEVNHLFVKTFQIERSYIKSRTGL